MLKEDLELLDQKDRRRTATLRQIEYCVGFPVDNFFLALAAIAGFYISFWPPLGLYSLAIAIVLVKIAHSLLKNLKSTDIQLDREIAQYCQLEPYDTDAIEAMRAALMAEGRMNKDLVKKWLKEEQERVKSSIRARRDSLVFASADFVLPWKRNKDSTSPVTE